MITIKPGITAKELDEAVNSCTEQDIIDAGWMRLGNGYLGPYAMLSNGEIDIMFWDRNWPGRKCQQTAVEPVSDSQAAYTAGREAYTQNIKVGDNPYEETSNEHWQWMRGWADEGMESRR